jgi:hypothetical protein
MLLLHLPGAGMWAQSQLCLLLSSMVNQVWLAELAVSVCLMLMLPRACSYPAR